MTEPSKRSLSPDSTQPSKRPKHTVNSSDDDLRQVLDYLNKNPDADPATVRSMIEKLMEDNATTTPVDDAAVPKFEGNLEMERKFGEYLAAVRREESSTSEMEPLTNHADTRSMEDGFSRNTTSSRSGIPPSSASKIPNFLLEQAKCPIYVGRPSCGMSVGLYHEIFTKFKQLAADTTTILPPKYLSAAHELISASAEVYKTEDSRNAAIGNPLAVLLKGRVFPARSGGEIDAYGILPAFYESTSGFRNFIPALVFELKNEIGAGKNDPSLQGYLSSRAYFTQPEHEGLLYSSPCPHFILAVAGPWMVISAGAFGPNGYVGTCLTSFLWVGVTSNRDETVYRVARNFWALSSCVQDLYRYYQALPLFSKKNPNPARLFPCVTRLSETQTLQYTEQLTAPQAYAAIFKATLLPDGIPAIVKFTERYNYKAQRLLSEYGFAPRLLVDPPPSSIFDFHVVVMEYIPAPTAVQKWHDNPYPTAIIDSIRAALKILHQNNFVFGDLRGQNILVPSKGSVRLVDFDWCGEDGSGRYPPTLNDCSRINWHPNVARGGIMEKEHDDYLLTQLEKGTVMLPEQDD